MKNKIKFLGLIALVAVSGFALTACGGGNTIESLSGAWSTEGMPNTHWFQLANGEFTRGIDEFPNTMGTYTISGSTITFTDTHFFNIIGGWIARDDERVTTAAVRRGTFTWDNNTFTKLNKTGSATSESISATWEREGGAIQFRFDADGSFEELATGFAVSRGTYTVNGSNIILTDTYFFNIIRGWVARDYPIVTVASLTSDDTFFRRGVIFTREQ